jgi:hypothetical protein
VAVLEAARGWVEEKYDDYYWRDKTKDALAYWLTEEQVA